MQNYKANPYGFVQIDDSVPTETSIPVDGQQPNQEMPQAYVQNVQGYPQLPPQNYFVPVNGPNGVMFVPVSNGYPTFNAPIQGQAVYGQQQQFVQPNAFYGMPMAQPQPQPEGPGFFENMTGCWARKDDVEKYQFFTRVMFIVYMAITILQVVSGFKRHFHPWLIFGIVQSGLFALTYCTARRALKMKSLNMMKRFIRRGRILFWITVYNLLMVVLMAHMFGVPGFMLLLSALAHGKMLCSGKKLFKNQLKTAWAGIQDPCPKRGCCRGGRC
jgi:hypothetical protein